MKKLPADSNSGMTMVELGLALAILSVVLAVTGVAFKRVGATTNENTARSSAEDLVDVVLKKVQRDLVRRNMNSENNAPVNESGLLFNKCAGKDCRKLRIERLNRSQTSYFRTWTNLCSETESPAAKYEAFQNMEVGSCNISCSSGKVPVIRYNARNVKDYPAVGKSRKGWTGDAAAMGICFKRTSRLPGGPATEIRIDVVAAFPARHGQVALVSRSVMVPLISSLGTGIQILD